MSAAEGQEVMSLTLSTLKSMRDDDSFDKFWQSTSVSSEELNVESPVYLAIVRHPITLMKVQHLCFIAQQRSSTVLF